MMIMKKKKQNFKLNKIELENSKKDFQKVLSKLKSRYPDSSCSLIFSSPWELLVATILSAQCTDKRVNMVTPLLFMKFPSVRDMAEASQESVEVLVKSTGFYRNKAKSIIGSAIKIVTDFGGDVPSKMIDLLKLPGVARKTANVILWNAFGINDGVVVDTHVGRISQRLGWTSNKTPIKIEEDLIKLVPKKDWGRISHLLIDLGREFCKAPTPNCSE